MPFRKGYIPHNKGLKGYTNSGSFKEGSSGFAQPHSEVTKKKMSEAKKGKPSHRKGKKLSYPIWNKGLKGYLAGEKHYNWKGGISPEHSRVRESAEYKNWRRDVFIRDHFTCQKCGHRFIKIVAHHIKSFAEYKKLWFNVNNGQTLCRSCHIKIHKPHL